MGKKNGVKISKVKRSNHMCNKLSIRKKLKRNKKPKKFYGLKPPNPEPKTLGEEENTGEEMLEMMEHEDVEFLKNAVTAQSYEIMQKIRARAPRTSKRRHGHGDRKENDDTWEKLYEQELDQPDAKRTKVLLPIKTKEGLVMRSMEISPEEEENMILQREIKEKKKEEERERKKLEKKMKKGKKDGEEEMKEEKEEEIEEEEDSLEKLEKEYQFSSSKPVATVDLLACREELLQRRKFQIGLLSAGLLENPEMKIHNFKFLLEILDTEHSEFKLTVRKLAALSLAEIFKDLLPGYQIWHNEPKEGVKLKKETLLLQNYEQSLLKAYKMFLQSLEKMSKVLTRKRGDARPCDEKTIRLGLVGVRCMADLLVRHPYFNFSRNIGQALVHFLDNKNPTVREIALKALRTVLKEDKRGELSLHIVRRINRMVCKKKHDVRLEVLQVLLALRLRDVNLDAEKEKELKEKKSLAHKKRLLNLSKRERKRKKRLEEVERELLETKAEESKQTKQKHLTEVTKIVFTIFFRVLKRAPSSKLLSITLEGLAKYAHCINLEFFQDLVNVLHYLLENENLGHVEQLHCVETVFVILSGQGQALNIDPMRFYSHLYRSLLEIHGGKTNADAKIVIRTLEIALIARQRKMSLQRLLAFTKRLCTLAPHLLHGAAMGYLAVIRTLLLQTKACDVLLDTDTTHGDGIYQPELPEPEYCSAGASVLWELTLMNRHYHPEVRQIAKSMVKGDEAILPPGFARLTPSKLAATYDCSQMVFRPAVPAPKNATPKSHRGRLVLASDELAAYLQDVEESVNLNTFPKWELPELDTSVC